MSLWFHDLDSRAEIPKWVREGTAGVSRVDEKLINKLNVTLKTTKWADFHMRVIDAPASLRAPFSDDETT